MVIVKSAVCSRRNGHNLCKHDNDGIINQLASVPKESGASMRITGFNWSCDSSYWLFQTMAKRRVNVHACKINVSQKWNVLDTQHQHRKSTTVDHASPRNKLKKATKQTKTKSLVLHQRYPCRRRRRPEHHPPHHVISNHRPEQHRQPPQHPKSQPKTTTRVKPPTA